MAQPAERLTAVRLGSALVLALAIVVPIAVPHAGSCDDSLEFFAPWIQLDRDDARDLAQGKVVARTLPATEAELAVFFAGAIATSPDAFVNAVRRPAWLWQTPRVPRVVRLSNPPRLEDFAGVRVTERDAAAIRECRPGDCKVKLTANEMRRLQEAEALDEAFRAVLFDRVQRYRAEGLAAAADLHDHEDPLDLQHVASELLLRSPWLTARARGLAEQVERYPRGPAAGESFLYWLETTHPPKPTIQIVHVLIERRPDGASPEVLVASRQVYASHYLNGSLALSTLSPNADGTGRYLAYVTRVHLDGLTGWPRGLRRFFIERSVRERGREAFERQRRRLEADAPAPTGGP